LLVHARFGARFRMIFRKAGLSIFERRSCARARLRKSGYRFFEKIALKPRRPAAIRQLGGADARTIERMDAIRNMKTMAGSPDADLILRSASRNLAHGLCVSGGSFAREPMKEDHNV
jgi:hypothetical protein